MEAKRAIEPPRWRTSRIERKAEAEPIAERLADVAEELNLKTYYPKERINEIVEGATHLAVNHELKQEFFGDTRKCMFLLGVAEEWEDTKNFKERKALLGVLSIAAISSYGRRQTLSGKVAKLSDKGLGRGTEFDPLAENTRRAYLRMEDREIEKDTDEGATTDLEAQLDDWSGKSIFAHVREKLGTTHRGRERIVHLVRLKLSAEETKEKYGWVDLCRIDYGGKYPTQRIILNSEATAHELEHEYAHSQSASVASGFSRLLDRGLTEALTENAISAPTAYCTQRGILVNDLMRSVPNFETVAYRAYVSGTHKDVLQMDKLIIAKYGLRGRLALARMWDSSDTERKYGRPAECLLNPVVVDYQLCRLKKKPGPPKGY